MNARCLVPHLPICLDVMPGDAAGLLVSHALCLDTHATVGAADVRDVLKTGAIHGRTMRRRLD